MSQAGITNIPAAGGVTSVSGGNNITITGTAANPIVNVSGTTNHSLLVGNATGSINSLGVATNGQIPIGSTGADPVLATLTAGTNISIANAAGSITIASTGAVPTTFTEDSGSATPALNNLNILGTAAQGIVTSGAGSTVTITADNATSAQKGVAKFDSTNFTVTAGNVTSNAITVTAGTGISVSGSPVNLGGTVTISASGTTTLTYTNVTNLMSPYTVLTTDEYISVDCSGGAVTLKFPNAATSGRAWIVKDRTGSAAASNITITTVGGVVNIDGAATYVMNTNFQSIQIIGNGSTYEIY